MSANRKRVKHVHEPGDLHEFTFSCYQRRPLLTNDKWRTYLADSINAANEQFNFQLIAFVFMPDHVHLLNLPTDAQPEIARYLAAIKRPVSAAVKADLSASRSRLRTDLFIEERPGKMVFRFWQEGPGYDRNIRTAKTTLLAVDYLHANPVRRGLCRQSIDWTWSSARWHAADGQHVDTRLPKLSSLPMEFGWRVRL
jgi:putative transposase